MFCGAGDDESRGLWCGDVVGRNRPVYNDVSGCSRAEVERAVDPYRCFGLDLVHDSQQARAGNEAASQGWAE